MKISRNVPVGKQGEQGVAAILTVIFFILIASVIAVGFMRLSLNEGEQALEDSLSKSALAAAYSGVSDAKRAILYCLQHENDPVGHPECDENEPDGINNQSCPGFFVNDTLTGNLGMPEYSTLPDGSMPVGDDPTDTINERYTCVTITNDTYDVSGPLTLDQSDGNSTLVPLRSDSAFNSVRISWHKRSVFAPDISTLTYGGGGNETRANYRDNNAYGNNFEWHDDWPAMLRMSLFSHPRAGITYNSDATHSTNIAEKTSYLYPRNGGVPTSAAVGALIPRQMTNCDPDGYNAAGSLYICQMTITGLGGTSFDPAANTLYLQLSNMYVDTDFTVELLSGITPVLFDDVSPRVDSTGAVGDVYRRVEVRLRYQGSAPILPNALDTGSGICKNFIAGFDRNIFSETCGY